MKEIWEVAKPYIKGVAMIAIMMIAVCITAYVIGVATGESLMSLAMK